MTEIVSEGQQPEVSGAFSDEKTLDTLPTERLKDFVRNVAKDITFIAPRTIDQLTLQEKSALVSHPVFKDILSIFALEVMVGVRKPTAQQMSALRYLGNDWDDRNKKSKYERTNKTNVIDVEQADVE